MSWSLRIAYGIVAAGLVLVAIDVWQWKTRRGPYRFRR
jgi:hypothetical protein